MKARQATPKPTLFPCGWFDAHSTSGLLLWRAFGRTQVSKIVLCVDDSATMQMVADITFRGTDFQYVGARSVDEALQKAKAGKPAIVLADSQMPGKTGYDLCQELKASMPDVPVVILVGNGAPYDAAK